MTPRLRIPLRPLLTIGLALGLGAFAAGCKQGVGDRCQVDSDCQDNLVCVIPSGQSLAQGGSCQPTGSAVDMSADFTAGPDMAMAVDGSQDLTAAQDLTAVDTAAAQDLTVLDGSQDGQPD
jgi:hypothetical protein